MAAGRAAASRSGAAKTGGGSGQRVYKDPHSGLETSYGAPIHTTKYGQVAQSPQKWSVTKDKVDTVNRATRAWNKDLIQNNILGALLPFGLQNVAPRYDQPATYAGGTYHFGMNPAAAAGGLGGMALGPAGVALGPLMGKGYSLADGKNLVFSGPENPSSWSQYDSGPMTGPMQSPNPNQLAGGKPTEGGQPIQGPVQAPMPGIFAAQQQAQNPAPQTPTIFKPKAPAQTPFQVPGGAPYGFSIFGRAA